MNGQDGSLRTLIDYATTDTTVLGGIVWKPVERFELGIDAVWTEAEAALDPFALEAPVEYLERFVNQSYDFSLANTNSDLDVTRIELGLRARYELRDGFGIWGGYRRLDHDDDAPYLGDTSGSLDVVQIGLAWTP